MTTKTISVNLDVYQRLCCARLIDLQNERRGRAAVQGATAFLKSHRETVLFLPVVALGKCLEGFSDVGSRSELAIAHTQR